MFILLIVTGTGNGVASEFFNLYLSVSEILFSLDSLFCILGLIQNVQIFTSLKLFFQGLGITGRPLFQCLICVERYLAVVHPVTFLKYKPLRYRVICCTAAWIFSVGFYLFSMFILVLLSEMSYTWFYIVLFLLFLFIQLFCLVAVLRALNQERERRKTPLKEECFISF